MTIRSVFRSFSVVFTSVVALVLITLLLKQSPTQAHSLYRATAANCVGSIQACIDASSDGDTIVIAEGTYTESLTLSKPVSLTGENRDTTIIHALAGQRVLTVTGAAIGNSVVISGLTLADGLAEHGGGILLDNQAQPVIHNLILYNNRADQGGGLYSDSPLSLIDTRVISNSAIHDGGGAYIGMTATLTNGEFIANGSGDNGGGAYLLWAATLTGTQFSHNHGVTGGGLFADLSTAQSRWVLTNTEFFGNVAQEGGGAAVGGTAQINGGRFENNTASAFGGGLFGDRATLNGTEFINNSAVSYGGGAVVNDASVNNASFERNSVSTGDGGGIYAGLATIADTDFISNTAVSGSGLYVQETPTTTVKITSGQFAHNSGTSLVVRNPLELTGTQFSSNTGTSGGAIGIDSDRASLIADARFENNQASHGGGIWFYGESNATYGWPELTLNNTFFVNNSAVTGGGIYIVRDGSVVKVVDGKFERNTAEIGGGIHAEHNASLFISGTIFLSNTVTSDPAYWIGGGGISAIESSVAIDKGVFQGNSSTSTSGGLQAYDLVMTDTEFVDNSAATFCGGVYVHAYYTPALINGGRFERNRTILADTDSYGGGGLCTSGGLNITGTVFISNSTPNQGGAIYFPDYNAQPSHIVNTLFADNTAGRDGAAIAIPASVYPLPDMPNYLSHVTIAAMSSNPQAAIYLVSHTLYLSDTIIANHTIAISNTGGTVYEDYNLFYNNITNTFGVISDGGHSLIGDPKFVDPLHGNYHLQSGSAAIDHGIDAGVYTDLDGHLRPVGAGFDIGAYEFTAIMHRLYLPIVLK